MLVGPVGKKQQPNESPSTRMPAKILSSTTLLLVMQLWSTSVGSTPLLLRLIPAGLFWTTLRLITYPENEGLVLIPAGMSAGVTGAPWTVKPSRETPFASSCTSPLMIAS